MNQNSHRFPGSEGVVTALPLRAAPQGPFLRLLLHPPRRRLQPPSAAMPRESASRPALALAVPRLYNPAFGHQVLFEAFSCRLQSFLLQVTKASCQTPARSQVMG